MRLLTPPGMGGAESTECSLLGDGDLRGEVALARGQGPLETALARVRLVPTFRNFCLMTVPVVVAALRRAA